MNNFLKRLLGKRQAYRRLFLTDQGELNQDAIIVMTDLRKFCRATGSTAVMSPIRGTIDPIAMAMAEGRREVFNRINEYLLLNDRTIHNLREEETND